MRATAPDWAAPCHTFREAEMLSSDEAAAIVAAAEQLDAWAIRGAYAGNLTCDIDALKLPEAAVAMERHGRLLSESFHVQTSAIRLTDLRVVKYTTARGGLKGLPLHSDGSALSFVCALNDCGEGEGGTYVRVLDRIISPPPGHALLFCGRWVHAGVPITSGVRYVLTGFLEVAADDAGSGGTAAAAAFSPARMLLRAMERVVEHEQVATVARRLCPGSRCWLRREFGSAHYAKRPRHPGGGAAGVEEAGVEEAGVEEAGVEEAGLSRCCSRCEAAVPRDAVRHCCCGAFETCGGGGDGEEEEEAKESTAVGTSSSSRCDCGTAWCETCLREVAAEAEMEAAAAIASEPELAPEDEMPPVHCELVADVTLPDGTSVEAGSWQRKVWRLRWTFGEEGAPCDVGALRPSEAPRLVRADLDTDERIGSRDLGVGTFTQAPGAGEEAAAGMVEAAVELRAPRAAGAYRIFFRLLAGAAADAPAVSGTNELFAEFLVE